MRYRCVVPDDTQIDVHTIREALQQFVHHGALQFSQVHHVSNGTVQYITGKRSLFPHLLIFLEMGKVKTFKRLH